MTKTLLIAEDDAPLRKLLSKALARDDYRVFDVGDGVEALDVVKREPVDLLITDVMMPNMDGIELLEQARALQPDICAIVITGESTSDAVIGAFRNQACDLLLKPFSYDELRAAVADALNQTARCNIEIISAKPNWIEIRVPCDLRAVERVQKLLMELEGNLPKETREAVGSVFRELLNNAIEHGGKCDRRTRSRSNTSGSNAQSSTRSKTPAKDSTSSRSSMQQLRIPRINPTATWRYESRRG